MMLRAWEMLEKEPAGQGIGDPAPGGQKYPSLQGVFWQFVLFERPGTAENVPPDGLHGSGEMVPLLGQKEPGGHSTQVSLSLAAGYCEYVPGAHATPSLLRPLSTLGQ